MSDYFFKVLSSKDTKVFEFDFGQPREKVIDKTVIKSLDLLFKEILKN